MDKNLLLKGSYYLGMALVVIGVIAQLTGNELGGYILLAGSLPIIGVRFYNRWEASPEHQRIHSILLLSSFMLLASAIVIILGYNFWIVLIFMTSMIDIYASFRQLN